MSGSPSAEVDSRRAWFTVVAAFLAGFVVFGITYNIGAFVEPMAADLRASRAATSALFSITGLTFYALGPFAGHLSDRFGPRIVVSTGAVLLSTGLGATAFIERIWDGYLTYGIGVGLGAACVYVPTLAIVGGWFAKRRSMALGIAAAGTGCGMLIVPPLAAALIEHLGWRNADILLGIGCASILMICAALTDRPPIAPSPAGRSLYSVVRSRPFAMLYVSWVLATAALFVPFVFLPAFARGQGASQVMASALISVLGGMSVAGRLGIGVLGGRIGTLRLFKIATFAMAASYLIWLTATTAYGGLVMFTAVLGLGYGVRISLMPVVLIEFFGMQNLGAILGVFFTATGIAAFAGPPLAGLIVDVTCSYRWVAAFAFATGLLGFVAVLRLKAGPVPTSHPV